MSQFETVKLFQSYFKGLNTKVSPDKIDPNESPDCSNVMGNEELGTTETILGYTTSDFSPNPILGAPGGTVGDYITGMSQHTLSTGLSYLIIHCGNKIVYALLRNAYLRITTDSVPAGTHMVAYTTTIAATGGKTNYTWSTDPVVIGSGPVNNLVINSSTGVISGTMKDAGTYDFDVICTDSGTSTTGLKQVVRKGFRLVMA